MKSLILVVSVAGLVTTLGAAPVSLWAASLSDQAVYVRDTQNGTVLVEDEGMPPSGSGSPPIRDPWVVWSEYLTDAIYNTAATTVDGYVFSGTYLNPPKTARLYSLGGGGTPDWTYGGSEFRTDAGDDAFILAAIDEYGSDLDVIKWSNPATYVPDWTATFLGYGATSYGPIAVSDDGSTIAVIAAPSGADAHLLLFDAGSATPLVDYVATGLGFPRYVKINSDGRYTAFIAASTLVIYDRDLLSVRDQISMGATNDASDISGDGDLIAYGWQNMKLMEWDGASYQNLWTCVRPGYYVTKIAISADGSTIVSGWYNLAHTTIKVVVHSPASSTPLWTYDYPTSSGFYQESCADIDITDDGSVFVIGSWGDYEHLNNEISIFKRDAVSHPYHTVNTPGSMFSVDITGTGDYVTACGKHIHANESGRGGDIFMIDTDLGEAGVGDDLPVLDANALRLHAHPNPFSSQTLISYRLVEASDVTLRIYDCLGREVATLVNGEQPAGERSHLWDGEAHSGLEASDGIYFIKLTTDEGTETRKVMILR